MNTMKDQDQPFPFPPEEHKLELGDFKPNPNWNGMYIKIDALKDDDTFLRIPFPATLEAIFTCATAQMEINARKAISDALPELKIGPVICEVSRNNSKEVPYNSTTFFSICVFDDRNQLLAYTQALSIGEAIGDVIQKLQTIQKP